MRGQERKPFDCSPIVRAYNKITLLEAHRLIRTSMRKKRPAMPCADAAVGTGTHHHHHYHRVAPIPSPSSVSSTLTYSQCWTTLMSNGRPQKTLSSSMVSGGKPAEECLDRKGEERPTSAAALSTSTQSARSNEGEQPERMATPIMELEQAGTLSIVFPMLPSTPQCLFLPFSI